MDSPTPPTPICSTLIADTPRNAGLLGRGHCCCGLTIRYRPSYVNMDEGGSRLAPPAIRCLPNGEGGWGDAGQLDDRAGLPPYVPRVRREVPQRRRVRRLPGAAALADGALLSGLRRAWGALASDAGSTGLSYLSPPDIRDSRHDPRQDPHPPDDLVRGRLASDDRQERSLGHDPGAHPGYQLPDCLGAAAALPRGDGAQRARRALGSGRGR